MWRRPTTHKNNMPKTTNGLWAKLIDFDNLYQAFQEARHGKRYRLEVMRFASNLEENLINLQNHLIWKTWAPGKQREFTVFEPKMRMIQAPPRDHASQRRRALPGVIVSALHFLYP